VADPAPEHHYAGSLGDHRANSEAGNFNAANQVTDGRRRMAAGGWTRIGVCLSVAGQPIELTKTRVLEDTRVRQDEPAIEERRDSADEEHALNPAQKRS